MLPEALVATDFDEPLPEGLVPLVPVELASLEPPVVPEAPVDELPVVSEDDPPVVVAPPVPSPFESGLPDVPLPDVPLADEPLVPDPLVAELPAEEPSSEDVASASEPLVPSWPVEEPPAPSARLSVVASEEEPPRGSEAVGATTLELPMPWPAVARLTMAA